MIAGRTRDWRDDHEWKRRRFRLLEELQHPPSRVLHLNRSGGGACEDRVQIEDQVDQWTVRLHRAPVEAEARSADR